MNKIGGTKEFHDVFHGRVSGYPKTTWVLNLNHLVYDAGKCIYYSLPYEGIWLHYNTKACSRSSLFRGKTKFKQSHLATLKALNLTFPSSWVSRGVVRTKKGAKGISDPGELFEGNEEDEPSQENYVKHDSDDYQTKSDPTTNSLDDGNVKFNAFNVAR